MILVFSKHSLVHIIDQDTVLSFSSRNIVELNLENILCRILWEEN